jgi:hypothetical protein
MKTNVKALMVLSGTFVFGWSVSGAVLLDSLALIETGATGVKQCPADFKRGRCGEVSRYQIKPVVWRKYSAAKQYTDPLTARRIADRVLNDRMQEFAAQYSRGPNPFEIYILWNAPAYLTGEYRGKRCSRLLVNRAQRFANLVYAQTSWSRMAAGEWPVSLATVQRN